MTGYVKNIEKLTVSNNFFRQVLYTGQHLQLVVMSIEPRGEIGLETHETTDQFFRVESGQGKVVMNGEEHALGDGDVVVVPAGTKHNIINTSSKEALKLYTLYAPPHHKDQVVHKTKAEANRDAEDHL